MKNFYTMIVALLTVSLSVSSDVQAAMLDLAPVWTEGQSLNETPARPGLGNLSVLQPVADTPVHASARIVGLFYQAPSIEVQSEALESLSDQALEAALQEELLGTPVAGGSFFKSKEFLGILILTFGIGSILAFFFGAGGSGSGGKGSGGGGGGGPSNSNNNSIFGDDNPGFGDDFPGGGDTCLVNCTPGGNGDGEGDGDGSRDIPDGIPSNPEPSTLFLLGLGLLLPFLRKKA